MPKGKPVIMAVTATIVDPDAYRAYMTALVESGLFTRHGATPLATGAVSETLEGVYAGNEITALIEFPSSESAHAFWDGPDYQAIARLRETAGDFRVGLWRRFSAA